MSWVVVLLLAWSQLALAGHQFDHVADDADAACQVCGQLDRLDDYCGESSAIQIEFSINRSLLLATQFKNFDFVQHRRSDIRGPPAL